MHAEEVKLGAAVWPMGATCKFCCIGLATRECSELLLPDPPAAEISLHEMAATA